MLTFAQGAWLLALLLGQTPEVPATWLPPEGFVEEKLAADVSPPFVSERAWSRKADGWTEWILEMRTRKRLSLRRYLEIWRGSHACTLRPVRGNPPLAWSGDQQGTWSGSCEGSRLFVMHVARLGNSFFEFHVGQLVGPSQRKGPEAGRDALARLLGAIQRPPTDEQPDKPKRASRAEARRLVMRLPMVRAFGGQVRLRALEDAAEIGPLACTGKKGECLYWFRAETQQDGTWTFWRLFGVCPYDGELFMSRTPNVLRAQEGDFQPIGPRRGSNSSGAGK
jgi:hypothetical protein